MKTSIWTGEDRNNSRNSNSWGTVRIIYRGTRSVHMLSLSRKAYCDEWALSRSTVSRAGKCRHFSAVEKFSQGKNFDRLSFFDLFWITHASVYKVIGKIIKENRITFFFSEAEIIWWELFFEMPGRGGKVGLLCCKQNVEWTLFEIFVDGVMMPSLPSCINTHLTPTLHSKSCQRATAQCTWWFTLRWFTLDRNQQLDSEDVGTFCRLPQICLCPIDWTTIGPYLIPSFPSYSESGHIRDFPEELN